MLAMAFGPVFNPANAITASRYFTLPAFYYFLVNGAVQWATAMLILCAVIDLFDGLAARAFGCSSTFGEMFDAITDAICYIFILVVSTLHGYLPMGAMVLMATVGGLNIVFRGLYARRAGKTTNYRSYAMERCLAYVVYTAGAGLAGFEIMFYAWSCAIIMTVIVLHDAKRMLWDPVPA